jgi:hypothetical protein
MLEYQSMLDQQREEIARRKAEERERKRKEDEALERKLQQQRERMRIEFEEEQRRLREREVTMEKKRQDVIQAIEQTSQQVRMEKLKSKKGLAAASVAETMSLMSVDAVISANNRTAAVDELMAVKRAQSMYEVSSGTSDQSNKDENKNKTFADACIQTDYSLILSWLFNMNERKDWEAFLLQRDAGTLTSPTEEGKKRSETRAIGSQTDSTSHDVSITSSSVTISSANSPVTYPIVEKNKSCVTKVKPITHNKKSPTPKPVTAASASSSTHPKSIPMIKGRCKWNMGSTRGKSESASSINMKQVHDFRRRHTTNTMNGSSPPPFKSEEAASSSDSMRAIINGEG